MVLRYLLRNWLRQKAYQMVREKVAPSPGVATPGLSSVDQQPSCDVGVVFALGIESAGLEDLLEEVTTIRALPGGALPGDCPDFREAKMGLSPSRCPSRSLVVRRGKLKHRDIVVIRSGASANAAAGATEALVSGHDPKWIISAGFAGGLSPKLERHDLVMVDNLVDLSGNRLAVDLKVDPAALTQTPGVRVGRLLSADSVIRLPREKRALGEKHEALAVDMESFAVAEVCRRRKVRFLAVRIISDAVDEELPPDVQRLIEQKTHTARLGAAVGAIFRRPGSLKDMYRLKEDALVASDRLAKFLVSTIEQLAPLPPAQE